MSKNTQPPTDSIKNGRRTKGLDPKTKGEVGGTEQGETKCIETGQNKNTHADVTYSELSWCLVFTRCLFSNAKQWGSRLITDDILLQPQTEHQNMFLKTFKVRISYWTGAWSIFDALLYSLIIKWVFSAFINLIQRHSNQPADTFGVLWQIIYSVFCFLFLQFVASFQKIPCSKVKKKQKTQVFFIFLADSVSIYNLYHRKIYNLCDCVSLLISIL